MDTRGEVLVNPEMGEWLFGFSTFFFGGGGEGGSFGRGEMADVRMDDRGCVPA